MPTSTRPTSRRRPRLVGVALAAGLLGSLLPSVAGAAMPSKSASECLARTGSNITVVPDGTIQEFREHLAPDNHTYDLRGVKILGNGDKTTANFDPKPVTIGSRTEPRGFCLLGGFIQGTQSRSLDWETLKRGGADKASAFIATTGEATVNGMRVDNMMTGIRTVNNGVVIKNAYYRYIRDDCVENDTLLDLRIQDSLFEGCYVAFSQEPNNGSPLYNAGRDRSVLEIDRVLVHSQRMPGGFNQPASARTHGPVFKVAENVSGPIRVTNSVFLIEPSGRKSESALDWPSNVTANNVTVVWTGSGSYPGDLPSGVTVTKDRSVWDAARADWLARHGCSSVTSCDNKKIAAPSQGGTTPAPAPDPEPEPEPEPAPDADPEPLPDGATATPVARAEGRDGRVVVTWTPSSLSATNRFLVKRSTSEFGNYSKIATVAVDGTLRHVDTDVVSGRTYWYKVVANVKDARNRRSEPVSATPS